MAARARRAGALLLVVAAALLAGCAGAPKFTTDDGRRVNEQLLEQVRRYGRGERALRPAIARTAALADPDCDKQWELPFSVATAESWDEDDRVAWVRALGVDERLTVVASAPGSPLDVGERIVAIEGDRGQGSAEQMSLRLVDLRDQGRPFELTALSGRKARVQPFEVCRGYTRLAPPSTPQMQDYHWLLTMHPLALVQADLSEDEALWMVLWTQGLSEEGGARMKTYHYTTKIVGTLYSLATLASGFKGAAMAADAAIKAAQTTATRVATDFLKQQLVDRARDLARQTLATQLVGQVKAFAVRQLGDDPSGGVQVLEFMQTAADFRRSFSGLSRVAATVFDRADAWAFERAAKLHANPLAGFSLHQKLLEQGVGGNAFAFDVERLGALSKVAEARGMGDDVVAILKGVKPSAVEFALTGMPLATATRPFRYEDALESTAGNPFAFGLVDAMMSMPVESQRRP
ncbi:hypothetical protein [Ideonella sp. A 288]|uniref:hypothetical protein n=1 Tax=Ideonella sp. A 288 TaxID=1962181 RepID=UPI000B4A934F|nr:hypothetical protein [Ideonella sp. A 288]